MMIAEKLLACATLACATSEPLDPRNTLFLAFAKRPAGGAPDAIVGQLVGQLHAGHSGIALNGAGGAIVQSAGYAYYTPLPAASFGAGDFLLDVVFDGTNVPSMTSGSSYSLAVAGGYAYVSTSGTEWNYFVSVSPPSGRNHVAVGRQSGVVQVWLNGVRLLRAVDAGLADPISNVLINQYHETGSDITINGIRICYGVDLYGDNANIAVPTLPLGIV